MAVSEGDQVFFSKLLSVKQMKMPGGDGIKLPFKHRKPGTGGISGRPDRRKIQSGI